MKNNIVSILILFSSFLQAQTFSNIYYSSTYAVGGAPATYLSNDTLFSTSNIQNVFDRVTYRTIARSGTLLDSVEYKFDSAIYVVGNRKNTLTTVAPNLFVALHDVFDTINSSQINIFLLDNKLDTLKTKKVDVLASNFNMSFDVMKDGNGFTLLGVDVNSNRQQELFIAHYDLNLNLIWHNVIPDFRNISNQYYNGYNPEKFIKKDDYYYVTGVAKYTSQFTEEFIVKLDSTGNKAWDKRYQFQNKNGGSLNIQDLGNDSILINYGYISKMNGNTPYERAVFRIIDSVGNLIKDTIYPEEEAYYFIQNSTLTQDGHILMVGSYTWGGKKSVVWKMDKNLNTIWRRVYYHGDWEDDSWLYNIAEWSDGGIIATGTYFDKHQPVTNQYVFLWLLSLDANGCLDPNNCGSGIGYKEWTLDQDAVKVFPNPAKEFTTVKLPPNTNNGIVRIYNLNGALLLKQELTQNQTRIDLEALHLAPQTLLVEIEAAGKLYYKKVVVQN